MPKVTNDISGKFQLAGQPTGFPGAETRHELCGDSGGVDNDIPTEPQQNEASNFRSLLAEATDESTAPIKPLTPQPKISTASHTPAPNDYGPDMPQLALSELLRRIEASNRVRAERDATKLYVHNPFYLEHIFGNAPYTVQSCKRCTRRRKCPLHRHVFQQQTSISLCPAGHVRMNLYWAINDPVNAKSSWQFEVKEYFGSSGGGDNYWSRGAEELARKAHEKCKVFEMSERWRELAVRVVEDMRAEKRAKLRSNMARVRGEIAALAGAWEKAVRDRAREVERKVGHKKEMARAAGEAKKFFPELAPATEVDIIQSVELEGEIVNSDAIEAQSSDNDVQQPTSPPCNISQSLPTAISPVKPFALPTHPTPLMSAFASPTQKSATFSNSPTSNPPKDPEEPASFPSPAHSTAPSTQSTVPNTPSFSPSPPPASPSQKRKRSRTPASPPPLEIPPAKKVKKVTWAPELVDVERPRMASPELVSGGESYSPVDDEAEEMKDEIVACNEGKAETVQETIAIEHDEVEVVDETENNLANRDERAEERQGITAYETEESQTAEEEMLNTAKDHTEIVDGTESQAKSEHETGEEVPCGLFGSDDETSNGAKETEEETKTKAGRLAKDSHIVDDLVSGTDEADEVRHGVKFAMAATVEDLVDWGDRSD